MAKKDKEEIKQVYISKQNLEYVKQVILLMMPKDNKNNVSTTKSYL